MRLRNRLACAHTLDQSHRVGCARSSIPATELVHPTGSSRGSRRRLWRRWARRAERGLRRTGQPTRFQTERAARPGPATSSPSWPAASLSASFELASFPCSSSCSCPWSPCSDLLAGTGETVSRGPGCPSPSDGSGIASCAPRLRRTHRRASIFVDFNHVAFPVCAAREASETFRASRDDRVGVGAGLDHVTLFDLLVKERSEAVPARPQRIDLTHEPEYRKSGFSADMERKAHSADTPSPRATKRRHEYWRPSRDQAAGRSRPEAGREAPPAWAIRSSSRSTQA